LVVVAFEQTAPVPKFLPVDAQMDLLQKGAAEIIRSQILKGRHLP